MASSSRATQSNLNRASFFMKEQGFTKHSQYTPGDKNSLSFKLIRYFEAIFSKNRIDMFDPENNSTVDFIDEVKERLVGIPVSIIINPEISEHPYNRVMQKAIDRGMNPERINLKTEKIPFNPPRDRYSEFKLYLKNKSIDLVYRLEYGETYGIYNWSEPIRIIMDNNDIYTDDYSAIRMGYRDDYILGDDIFFDSLMNYGGNHFPRIRKSDSLSNFVEKLNTPEVLQARITDFEFSAPWIMIPKITVDIFDDKKQVVTSKQFLFHEFLLEELDTSNINTFRLFEHNAANPYSNPRAYEDLNRQRLGNTRYLVGHQPAALIGEFAPEEVDRIKPLVNSRNQHAMQRVMGNPDLTSQMGNYLLPYKRKENVSGGKKSRKSSKSHKLRKTTKKITMKNVNKKTKKSNRKRK